MSNWRNGGGGIELFLKYLPTSATEAKVRATYIDGAPSLTKVRLSVNKETGECKGIGWLTVTDEEDARRLMKDWNWKSSKSIIDGRNVEITRSVELGTLADMGAWQGDGTRSKQAGGKGFECRFGLSCKRGDCTFSHPPEWDPSSHNAGAGRFERPCKFGAICSRSDCLFQHPEQWNPDMVVSSGRLRNCKLGIECTFKGCFYSHPDGRAIDAGIEVENGEAEEAVEDATAPSKSFKLKRQSSHELARLAAEAQAEAEVAAAEAAELKKEKNMAKEEALKAAEAEASATKQKKRKKREAAAEADDVEELEDRPTPKRKKKKRDAEASAEKEEVETQLAPRPKKDSKHMKHVKRRLATEAVAVEEGSEIVKRKKKLRVQEETRRGEESDSDLDAGGILARTKANREAKKLKRKKLKGSVEGTT